MTRDQAITILDDTDEKFESPHFKMFIKNNILHCEYAEGLHLSLPVAKSSTEGRIFFSKGKSYPLMVDMKGVRSTSPEAGEYLTAIGVTLVKASALVIGSPVERMIGNVFLRINKPLVPTRMFTNENKAEDWLMRYVRQ